MSSDRNTFKQIIERKLSELWPEWQIVDELGNGAFGSVYKIARDLNGRSFYSALKVIRIERGSNETAVLYQQGGVYSGTGNRADEEYRNKITKALDEINIMEELKGAPNVVRIEDFQIVWEGDTALVFIRMELLQSLLNWIRENGIPDEETVRKIGTDICNALQFCAEKSIIHRDIKPANIFRDPYGSFKLGDFGISRQLDLVCGNSTLTAVGTVSYMAPEVYRMEPYDNTADIYSLGLVLYELSNHGRMPFLPPYPGMVSLVEQADAQARRMRGEPFPLPDNASKELGEVLCKACEKSPAKRYRSAVAFKEALEQCRNTNGGKQDKSSWNAKDKREKGNRAIVPAVIIVALMCLLIFVFLNKNSSEPKEGEAAAVESEVTPSVKPVEITPSIAPVEVTPSIEPEEATPSIEPEEVTPSIEPEEATSPTESEVATESGFSEDSQQVADQIDWPKNTVTVVFPYTEGSRMQVICNALFERIEKKTGGTFDISCLPGENGMVAALGFMDKEPDGYTVLFNHTAASLVQEAAGRFDYSFTDDFDNCATVAIDRSLVLCAAPSDNNNEDRFSDLTGMIEYAKAHPGDLRFCSVDGSLTEYVGDRLEELAGISFEYIDVGSAENEQIKALFNGNVDLAIFYYSSSRVMDYIKSGKLICLGVMANERVEGIDAPTMKEQGYDVVNEKKFEVKFPKGTDPAIIEYLSGLCKEVTEDPEFAEVLKDYYAEPYYRDADTMNAQDPVEVQEYRKYLHTGE